MSEHGVHVPHAHHGAERGLAQWVAIFTAIAATLGAIVGHESSEVANQAILTKNEAVLKQTEAANQWAYYQAVSTKAHLMELAKLTTPDDHHQDFDQRLAKYAKQKEEIQARAQALDAQVGHFNAESAALAQPRQYLAFSLALFQIAISVASVTVLTAKRWLFAVAGLSSLTALGFWGAALLLH